MSKREALLALGADPNSTFEQAKRSFRRQAMKWHPDRNPSPGAEEKFKSIRASYEVLEDLHAAGAWDRPEESETRAQVAGGEPGFEEGFDCEDGEQKGSKGHGLTSEDEGEQSQAPEKPPRSRKSWDPPEGPMFDVGFGAGDPLGSAWDFFASFIEVGVELMDGGARPRMAAVALSRGFHGYMSEMAFDVSHVPYLKGIFLRCFWSWRRAGLFEVAQVCAKLAADLGWATMVVDILNPLTRHHEAPGFEFNIFREIARNMPDGRPSTGDLEYYRRAAKAWPELFGSLPQSERALRSSMRVRGRGMAPLLIDRALEVCPGLLEVWAPLGTPRAWGTRSDWLGMALEAGVDPTVVEGWARDEELGRLCARLSALWAKPRRVRWLPLARLACQRMEEESNWRGAGPWAGAREALFARAQARLDRARAELRPGALGSAALGLGISSMTTGRRAAREAIFGEATKVGEALAKAKIEGRLGEALNFEGCPVTALCAMRGFFELDVPLDFYERAKGFEDVAGVSQLARPDPDGLSAMDWFERAIQRRKERGLE